jgi:hypothetical protein
MLQADCIRSISNRIVVFDVADALIYRQASQRFRPGKSQQPFELGREIGFQLSVDQLSAVPEFTDSPAERDGFEPSVPR